MRNLTTEVYLQKISNIYSLVILAAKRTVGLTRGEKPLIPETRNRKPMMVALDEIASEKITLAPPEEEKDAGEAKIL
jgi:DNA-directed RNA polymerase omega subunit